MSEVKPLIWETLRTQGKINANKTIPQHIIFKLGKKKKPQRLKRILKKTEGKKKPYLQRNKDNNHIDFSSEIMQARKERSELFKVLREREGNKKRKT